MTATASGRAADKWWNPARRRALAEIDKGIEAASERLATPGTDLDDALRALLEAMRVAPAARTRIRQPGWTPPRPGRRMPSLWKIAQYWAGRDIFDMTLVQPACFACAAPVPDYGNERPAARWNGSSGDLDRAHLADRFLGGLDGPQNLVPLCRFCHGLMPMFHDGREAIVWVQNRGPYGDPRFLATLQARIGRTA